MASGTSRTAAQKPASNPGATPSAATTNGGEQPAVNRKKQKRRQKQAAKLAAEQAASSSASDIAHGQNGHPPTSMLDNPNIAHNASHDSHYGQFEPGYTEEGDEVDAYYGSDDEALLPQSPSDLPANDKLKKKRKKKNRWEESTEAFKADYPTHPWASRNPPPPPPPPPPMPSMTRPFRHGTKDRIWNTSTAEERERIKEFWISLAEPERRSLVKVEKEAVLKKMKEQQKHSCSCTVCGRKRTAIEEELEVLYDAYYEELEQYANHRQIGLDSGHPMMPPPSSYPTMPKVPPRQDPRVMNSQPPNPHPMAGAFEEDEDDLDEEGYSEDDEEVLDESEEDYYPPEITQGPASDFFNFGKSLTVQGGILTVADDLLKNDGKKFIEMMEQLAERRMQREEEAQYAAAGLRHPSFGPHDHAPIEEDDYEEDDGEDYASEDDDEYEEDMGGMTEEQRMEEGRRMFQIFAARMFEQRVLTAYREKVARERQEKLLEELADENRLDAEREAKKAKDAQKKKDKKNKQKAAKEEEKQKREAEKATAEAAAKAAEEAKLEEQRQKKEEQRKKREAEKKSQEEERQRKEADKVRKQQELREQQAEQERKQREAREKEKRKKEDAKKREREERAKEREKKEREAAEKRELDAKLKAEQAAQEAMEKEARARARREDAVKQSSLPTMAVPVPPLLRKTTSSGIPPPPGLGHPSSAHASPHLQIATPIIPKAPTPMRPRQPSGQGSIHSSPKSTTQPPSGSSATSPSSASVQQPSAPSLPPANKPTLPQPTPLHTSMATSHAPMGAPSSMPPPSLYTGLPNMPPMSGPSFQSNFHPMMPPGIHPRLPHHNDTSVYANQPFSAPPYRGFNSPNVVGFPPGINGIRPMPPGRDSPTDLPTTQAPIGSGVTPGPIAPTSHSRHASASFESSSSQTQPIARPNPISRPNNAPQEDNKADVDDLSKHLGSSALLDDADDTLGVNPNETRMHMAPGGSMRSTRLGFAHPRFPEGLGSSKAETFPRTGGWAVSPMVFGSPNMSHHPSWPSAAGPQWTNSGSFASVPTGRGQYRPVAVRSLICQTCRTLSNNTMEGVPSGFGYHNVQDVLGHIGQAQPDHAKINLPEFLAICETEGNGINGGGNLLVQEERSRGTCVKWIPDTLPGNGRMLGGPGEIGSPIVGSAMPIGGGGRGFQPHGSGMQGPSF